MSRLIYLDSANVFYSISRTLSIQSFLLLFIFYKDSTSYFASKMHYSVVLIAVLHIFLSPEPYIFHLFDFVVFYVESTLLRYLHLKCLISIMLIVLLCIFYLQNLIHSISFDFVASYTFSTWLSFVLTLLHSFHLKRFVSSHISR